MTFISRHVYSLRIYQLRCFFLKFELIKIFNQCWTFSFRSVLTCNACHATFDDFGVGKKHYQSEWHCYNVRRTAYQMAPISEEKFKQQVAAKQEKVIFFLYIIL